MGVAHETRGSAGTVPPTEPVGDDAWTEIWNKQNLEGWLEEGLTRQQIIEKVAGLSGRPPMSKAAVSMAMARWGIPPRRARYDRTLPWRIQGEHATAKEAALLRFLGKRLAGGTLRDQDASWLADWIERLRDAGSPVIAYYPDSPDGFYPVRRESVDTLDVPYVDAVTLYDSLK